jgi:hypothetical protein
MGVAIYKYLPTVCRFLESERTMSIRIHSTIAGAIAALGEVQVSATWKQTANQTRKERAICIPMECVKAPEVPEAFRALVESCLMASAEQTLKNHVNDSPNNYEMLTTAFDRPQLVESFLAGNDAWMTKEAFELAFTASATWKRITSRAEFASNATYQAAANGFKDALLKLTAKPTYIAKDQRDTILSKLATEDVATEFGVFVVRRFEQMAKKDAVQTVSFADL